MLQEIIVYLIVAAAALYLARMLWQSASGKKGCGSCGSGGGCGKPVSGARQAPDAAGLIQINLNGSGYSVPGGAVEQGREGQRDTAGHGAAP
jgi:hypothetical protein